MMINKKLSRTLGPVFGILVFIGAVCGIETPVFADDSTTTTTAAATVNVASTTTSTQLEDYSVNINKSETQNGITVTVVSATATKHKLSVTLKVEGSTELQSFGHNNSLFKVSYGDKDYTMSDGSSPRNLDNKTMLLTLEKNNYEGEYPKSGTLRVDVVLSNYKVNIGMDIPVDFSKSFNNAFEKNITGTIPELDYSLNTLESDNMGTIITYTKPNQDETNMDDDNIIESNLLLKVGDKYYKFDSSGERMTNDKTVIGYYKSKIPSYSNIKDAKNISIIPIFYKIPLSNYEQYNFISNSDIKKNTTDDLVNKVSYQKDFNFSDGTKGTIYNIERNNNSVKIYCKGQSDLESLLMASSINFNYKYVKGQKDNIFYKNDCTSFYKDPKDALGYIVEFDNVQKDKDANIYIDSIIKQLDVYKLGDEIKILS